MANHAGERGSENPQLRKKDDQKQYSGRQADQLGFAAKPRIAKRFGHRGQQILSGIDK
jgi:hypothetical protein